MGRHKAKKTRRERSTPPVETIEPSTRILFDASDPRIEVFRRVKAQLQADIEPDPADLQLLWEWHNEDH
jgi:hypothetical protein